MGDAEDKESLKMEKHLSSAAAFVEGGIQDACDDSCSICLEDFCDSDPSTVTTCKHEFHLHCILEWCQRSSQCPMCWQSISLADPMSQELLDAVEQERTLRTNRQRMAAVFRHPVLGEFELPHLGADEELEERIIQHLAAAAAMRRTHRVARREGRHGRSTALGHPHYLLFSSQQANPGGSGSGDSDQRLDVEQHTVAAISANTRPSLPAGADESADGHHRTSYNNISNLDSSNDAPASASVSSGSLSYSSAINQDRAGPSDMNSFSEFLKSRFQAASLRYKESITKSTRGWRERLFSRNNNGTGGPVSEVPRGQVGAGGIATLAHMMERPDTSEDDAAPSSSSSTNQPDSAPEQPVEQQVISPAATAAVTQDVGSGAS